MVQNQELQQTSPKLMLVPFAQRLRNSYKPVDEHNYAYANIFFFKTGAIQEDKSCDQYLTLSKLRLVLNLKQVQTATNYYD